MEPVGAFETPEEMRSSAPLGGEGMLKSVLNPSLDTRLATQAGGERAVAVLLLLSRRVALILLY